MAAMQPSVLFAGGGTGGHVFPLVAVAEALQELVPGVAVHFVGTPRGMETRLIPDLGYPLHLLDVLPLRGQGVLGTVKSGLRACSVIAQGAKLLGKLRPRLVLSAGGYASGPISLAAHCCGLPVALLEPNSIIGLANRLLAPFVERAYTGFAGVEGNFPPDRVYRTGVPIRQGFSCDLFKRKSGFLEILVLGGSMGARGLNQMLPAAFAQAQTSIHVVHQCGRENDEAVRAAYGALELEDRVDVVPFIGDVAGALRRADLVVGRSGAGAVSEICAVGRASLLIPYPHAAVGEQLNNARSLEDDGASLCLLESEATPDRVARIVDELNRDSLRLQGMATRAARRGRPKAAYAIAKDLAHLGGISSFAKEEAS